MFRVVLEPGRRDPQGGRAHLPSARVCYGADRFVLHLALSGSLISDPSLPTGRPYPPRWQARRLKEQIDMDQNLLAEANKDTESARAI